MIGTTTHYWNLERNNYMFSFLIALPFRHSLEKTSRRHCQNLRINTEVKYVHSLFLLCSYYQPPQQRYFAYEVHTLTECLNFLKPQYPLTVEFNGV